MKKKLTAAVLSVVMLLMSGSVFAAETETVRLYTAILALAPQKHVTKLLEINADETDHQSILTDMLVEALTGQSAEQEKLVPGVR